MNSATKVSDSTGKSVLHQRRVTALTWYQEMVAHQLTRAYLGDYYRTYPETTVEEEVMLACDRGLCYPHSETAGAGTGDTSFYSRGPCGYVVPIPLSRDTPADCCSNRSNYVVRDPGSNLLTARWPGDAHLFGTRFVELLAEYHSSATPAA